MTLRSDEEAESAGRAGAAPVAAHADAQPDREPAHTRRHPRKRRIEEVTLDKLIHY